MTPKPAIVLVHGAWHTPQHYAELVSQLQAAGFEVDCPQLPTCQVPPAQDADMYTDAETVRQRVRHFLDDRSRDVVMLLHSYGGVVGTEAVHGLSQTERSAHGFSTGVTHLIYMCAFMLRQHQSPGSISVPRPDPEPISVNEETNTTFPCLPPTKLFYADVDPSLASRMSSLLVPQSAAALVGTITHEAWKHIPTTYLRTEHDAILLLDWQDKQIHAVRQELATLAAADRNKTDGQSTTGWFKVESYASSHSPFLSMPHRMVEAVQRAVDATTLTDSSTIA